MYQIYWIYECIFMSTCNQYYTVTCYIVSANYLNKIKKYI